MSDFEFYQCIDNIKDGSILQMLITEADFCKEKQLAICNNIQVAQTNIQLTTEPTKSTTTIKGKE
ncbi:MAG: hypothetical protein JST21_03090 [Bacteroidetes bacterium]|nr:hypothetical protein [Bacteroidota bacterium]